MSSWESLGYLIGEPLKFVLGTYEREQPDGEVKIIEEYENTVLLDMEYIHSAGWIDTKPRHVRYLIGKDSLACGDWVLKRMNGERVEARRLLV